MYHQAVVQVEFKLALPYLLRVRDGTYEGRWQNDQYVIITKAVETALEDPDLAEGEVRFFPNTGQIKTGKGVSISGAMLQYTEASIRFMARVSGPSPVDVDVKLECARAGSFLNHFLNAYRFLASHAEVRPLTLTQFREYRAGRALGLATPSRPTGKPGQMVVSRVCATPVTIRLGDRQLIPDVVEQELRRRLAAGQVPHVEKLLRLNVESYLQTGDNRLAVIDGNTALDIVSERKALQVRLRQGQSEADARQQIERITTHPLVASIVIPGVAFDIENHPWWRSWLAVGKPLRNAVVHDGYEPGAQEARDSCNVIGFLMDLIEGAQCREG